MAEPRAVTGRRAQILDRLCRGYSYRRIADDLAVSEDTVRTHCRRLYAQLGCSGPEDAVAAVRAGRVRLDLPQA